ncbi:MAG TPA: hypothetical protein VNQ73_09040 [Ilumatobacter sp.]|nr:hypothetical protein [Ilumatobacter sp.]
MIPTISVGNVRRALAIAAIAIPIGTASALGGAAAPAHAAAPGGTIVTIEGDHVVANRPDGKASHVVAEGSPLSSVSMANDGTIYIASDENYVSTDDTMWAFTQDGNFVESWKAPNPGLGELYGGISDSEVRRDGARIITQSIWSNCTGGGIGDICNVRYVTEPGSDTSLGTLTNEGQASWLGNSNTVIVNGGMEYWNVGAANPADWFEEPDLYSQWDAAATTTADGKVMALGGVRVEYDPTDDWLLSRAIAFYRVTAAPPAVPTRTCILTTYEMIGEDFDNGGYLSEVSFSPDGTALAFAAGEDFDDLSVYVISGLNTSTCAYSAVTQIVDGGVKDMYWGHAAYQPGINNPDPVPEDAVIVPVSPARYWDTRPESTFDNLAVDTGRLAADSAVAIDIAGRGKVPTGATGVVANLTVVGPDADGYATLYPCTATPPTASHVNYTPGAVVANNAVVPLDAQGRVCVYTKAGADFVLDVNGFVPASSDLVGVTPARYLDTRPGAATFDGAAAGRGAVAGGSHIEVQITGRGKVPAGAVAALVNVTAVGPDAAGYVTLYPCGTRPGTSTLNYAAGDVVPNGALVNLSANGTLCAFTKATSHVLIDVAGYVPAGAAKLAPVVPARLADTRSGQATVDGKHAGTGRLDTDGVIEVQIAGRGNVPTGASAAFFNVTVVSPSAAGYVTLYPCGTRPTTSNVNYSSAGVVRANNAMTQLSANGTVCLYTKAATDIVVDVTGWVG